ncbi:MAG: hypothetical protein AAF849_06680 [Bacteroidota bacterium]
MRKVFLLFITMAFCCLLFAQEEGFPTSTTPAQGADCNGTITIDASAEAGPFKLTLDATSSEPQVFENISGTFTFEGVCPGEHVITVDFMNYMNCYIDISVLVDQEACGSLENDIYIKDVTPSAVSPDGTITVVADGIEAPYTVRAVRTDPVGDSRTANNINGEHTFTGLVAGTYEITVTSNGNPACSLSFIVIVPPLDCQDIIINEDRIFIKDAHACNLNTGEVSYQETGDPQPRCVRCSTSTKIKNESRSARTMSDDAICSSDILLSALYYK